MTNTYLHDDKYRCFKFILEIPGRNTGVSLGDFPSPGIEPRSPMLQADSSLSEPPGKPISNEVLYPIYMRNSYNLIARIQCSLKMGKDYRLEDSIM